MVYKIFIGGLAMLALFMIAGCGENVSSSATGASGDWLVEESRIFDGGPGKDGIPALTTPEMISIAEVDYLSDNDLIIGAKIDDDIRAYPHAILDWHEIINDHIGGSSVAVTYCPLTGSGIGWDRNIGGRITTFGVSGLLFNTNLIPYDRATGSNWSQMGLQCINGELIGSEPEIIHLVETRWGTWKEMYPESKVVSRNTGHSRTYGNYPYGDYKTNNARLLFPIGNDDRRLPRKDRVLGIIVDEKTKAYPIDSFDSGIEIIEENFNGADIVIAGSSDLDFAVAFESRATDGTLLDFRALESDDLPAVVISTDATRWDIFGHGLQGPRKGERLKPVKSCISFWFAWGTFYPGAEIHN